MRLPQVRRVTAVPGGPGLSGPARVDRRTKTLTKRLQPGDIAVIDHQDLDKVSADALVGCAPAAVVNAAPSISGRYPNTGPEALIEAGILLIDDVGEDILHRVRDGDRLRVLDGEVHLGDDVVARGTVQDKESVSLAMDEARAGLANQIEAFVANTMDYMQRERGLLLDRIGVPEIATQLDGRAVLIVVRGYHYREDLAVLRPYIRENRPVLIGVDGGADAILEAGYRPHIVVGDMDSVTDKALTCGAEIVVHAYPDGRAPGSDRVRRLGIEPVIFSATGTSEDIAMLLADDKGASVIVAVGTHNTLEEFLDKGRSGMASTWLTRLRVGSKLVDAKGVSRLYRQRISNVQLAVLILSGLLAVLVALYSTPGGQAIFSLIGARLDDLLSGVTTLFVASPPEASGPVHVGVSA